MCLCECVQYDNYDAWFQKHAPGANPMAHGLSWNTWRAAPFEYDEPLHPTAWVGRRTVEFLRRYKQGGSDSPFFLMSSFHRPHSPYDPPRRWWDKAQSSFTHIGQPAACSGPNCWDTRYVGGLSGYPFCGAHDMDAWCGKMPEDMTLASRRAYAGNVAFVDEWIGNVLRTLREQGLEEDTWVVYVSGACSPAGRLLCCQSHKALARRRRPRRHAG